MEREGGRKVRITRNSILIYSIQYPGENENADLLLPTPPTRLWSLTFL